MVSTQDSKLSPKLIDLSTPPLCTDSSLPPDTLFPSSTDRPGVVRPLDNRLVKLRVRNRVTHDGEKSIMTEDMSAATTPVGQKEDMHADHLGVADVPMYVPIAKMESVTAIQNGSGRSGQGGEAPAPEEACLCSVCTS